MNDWSKLDAFLEKYNYNYLTKQGLLFNRVAPGFMFVDAPWPGNPIDDITLVYLCNDASAFFHHLQIKEAPQIEQVTSELLLNLFYAGEGILVCTTQNNETLEFQFSKGGLVANVEDCDVLHIVNTALQTPDEFMTFTTNYFLKLKEGTASIN